MQQENYRETFANLNLSSEQLQEMLENAKRSMGFDTDMRQWVEAKRVLSSSQDQLEHFSRIQTMRVSDHHVWSIKKPQLREELANELAADREALKDATDEFEGVLDKLKGLREQLQGLHKAYDEFAKDLHKSVQQMQDMGLEASRSADMLRREVLPGLERMLHRLDRLVEEFQRELTERLRMLDFIGRQISALRDEPLFMPVRTHADELDEEPPAEGEEEREGPSQAEELVEQQEEHAQQDRGRKDERQKKKDKKGKK